MKHQTHWHSLWCSLLIGTVLMVLVTIVTITDKNWNTFTSRQEADAFYKFPKEINFTEIEIGNKIASGEFAVVHEGRYCPANLSDCYKVAIKTLRAGHHERARQKLMDEASIMAKLDHPNVVKLIGVVSKTQRPMIIMEYMRNGTLLDYVRAHNRNRLGHFQLIKILLDVAKGLMRLAEMGYVHTDVAARNILVNDKLICKVSDFGLCRRLNNTDPEGTPIHIRRGDAFTVRWTAPDVIEDDIYSSSSDVWSFGVLMWEVFSYGEKPYKNMTDYQVWDHISSGLLMSPPPSCHPDIWKLMTRCWDRNRKRRPTFKQIVAQLDAILSSQELSQDLIYLQELIVTN